MQSWRINTVRGRVGQCPELPCLLAAAGLDGDIVTGQQRTQSGNAGQRYFRLDQPELCFRFQVFFGAARDVDVDGDRLQVRVQFYRLDARDLEAAVHQLGLAGFDAIGGVKDNLDGDAGLYHTFND